MNEIKQEAINTVRLLSVDMIEKANSGHPGLPLGAAPMAFTLFHDIMKHNPKNSDWFDRDRFILSAGHGSAMLYSLLHLFEYGISMEDIKNFRQLGSKTAGHPEYGHAKGIEATTGPLGQGMAMAVGMAIAEANLAARFNKDDLEIVDHYTYALVGDGDMQEGITNEAASLAGALALEKLIVLYDSNNITIEGNTENSFSEDVRKRFEALHWDTFFVEDGNDIEAIRDAIAEAKKTDRPAFIEIKTKIGYGSVKEGSADSHGAPLGKENIPALKENLQWKYEEDFMVPEEVYQHMKDKVLELGEEEILWNEKIKEYQDKYPKEYEEFQRSLEGVIPEDLLESDAFYEFEKDDASRGYSGTVLNRLAKEMPHLIGGSADLAPSNKTTIDGRENMRKDHMAGRNIQFGIREHAMAAISNGIALHGGLIPFCATFFVFSDYLKPAIRLSALMEQRVIYVFTHDSIGVGEDGPTHEPIEQLAMMRAMPNTAVYRPADGRETAAAYKFALENTGGPTALVLSRQKLPNLENTQKDISKGAYVYKDFGEHPELILMASGSELYATVEAAEEIHSKGYDVRVVSVPSLDQLNRQDQSYIDEIFPKNIRKRVSIECLSTFGWHRYTGLEGLNIGMDQFGASGNGDELMKHFGFDKESITKRIVAYLEEE